MSKSRSLELTIQGNLCGHEALCLSTRLPGTELSLADHVVLSLKQVTEADAAGIALLLRLYSHLTARGKRLSLRDVSRPVQALLDEVGLTSLFRVIDDATPSYGSMSSLQIAVGA